MTNHITLSRCQNTLLSGTKEPKPMLVLLISFTKVDRRECEDMQQQRAAKTESTFVELKVNR